MLWCCPALAAGPAPIGYPAGYRQWLHVKTMQIKLGHPLYGSFGGIHHIYANKKAAEGYKRGHFPNGSILVFDLLDARDEPFATVEGPRKLVAVMHKDSARHAATGGWGFEVFKGDSRKERLVGNDRVAINACFQCHAPQKSTDYVFSISSR